MDDLITFLRARLDHDEQVAREATPGPWRNAPTARHHSTASGRSEEAVFGAEAARVATTGEPGGRQHLVDAEHIARHDPARVLAEVEAKRQLVEKAADADRYSRTTWATAGSVGAASTYRAMVRLLALPFADHPDYREEWRP